MLNVIEIKDFNAPELDIYARCTEARLLNKDHPEDGMFIAESPKVIGRALDAGYEPYDIFTVLLSEGDTTITLLCERVNSTAQFCKLLKEIYCYMIT